MIRRVTIALLIAACAPASYAGAWGLTYQIEISGDGIDPPLLIDDPQILDRLSFWVGPGNLGDGATRSASANRP